MSVIEWAALAAALAPLVVAMVWALAVDAVPLGDSGQLIVRSRDVFTPHHPLLGAWSSSSRTLDADVNNLGSLYITLLAPFTRISPYRGGALGVGLVNLVSIVGVWVVARRLLGPLGVVAAMGATLAIETSMGSVTMLDARQQLALILPYWLLLWLVTAVWAGRLASLPAVAVVASLVLQTHFTFVWQTVILGGATTVAVGVQLRRRGFDRTVRTPLVVTVAVLTACWAQPLWDQLFGTGNLATVAGSGGEGDGAAGITAGVELAARAGLAPPFWAPGSMGRREDVILLAAELETSVWSWIVVALWLAGALLAYLGVRRRGTDGVRALAGVAAAGLVAGLFAITQITPALFSNYAAQNYFWMWPTGLLVALAVAAAGRERFPRRGPAPLVMARVALAPLLVLTAVTVSPASSIGVTSNEAFRQRSVAQEMLAELGASLDARRVRGPVVIDYTREQVITTYRYIFLMELQRRGIEYTFDGVGDSADLRRFGLDRCETGTARARLYLQAGAPMDQPSPPGEQLLARADPPPAVQAEARRWRDRMGELLRSERLVVTPADVGDQADELARVLDTPDAPIPQSLAPVLRRAGETGRLTVPAGLREEVEEWSQVERRFGSERISLSLAPIAPGTPPRGRCDS